MHHMRFMVHRISNIIRVKINKNMCSYVPLSKESTRLWHLDMLCVHANLLNINRQTIVAILCDT